MTTKRLALAAVLLVGALTACSKDNEKPASSGDPTTTTVASATSSTAPPPEEVQVTATEFAFELASDTLTTGDVTLTLDNAGEQEHQAQILRLKDGKTTEDFAALADDPSKLTQVVDGYGGPNGVAPGESFTTTQRLDAGSYLLVCFIPDADGQPHVAKGMLTPVTVEGEAPPPVETVIDHRIVTKDYDFGLGDDAIIEAGEYEFINDGPQPHEVVIYAPAEGKTVEDVMAFFSSAAPPEGPPPQVGKGGVAAISPGVRNIADLDLEPGDYVFVCFIPDVADGAPHFTKGMIQTVSVE